MTRPVHRAYVEERVDEEGARYFVAVCAETFTACDSYGYPEMLLSDWTAEDGETEAAMRALHHLGNPDLHDPGWTQDEHFCDADHVHAAAFDALDEEEKNATAPILAEGAERERLQIRRAQARALTSLRHLRYTEFAYAFDAKRWLKTLADCIAILDQSTATRELRAATRPEGRR